MIKLNDILFERLISWFQVRNQRAIVALSGGVDSAVVALAAKKALNKDAIAITADYNTLASDELRSAIRIAKEINIRHKIIRYNELDNSEFTNNDSMRCYHCRTELASYLLNEAKKNDVDLIVDGTHADDLRDFRPGIIALKENGVKSPLVELGINKKNVRDIAKLNKLSVFDKPSNSCLASRVPHGTSVTVEKLRRIEKAEYLVKSIFNVKQVRVRDHQDTARIEVGNDEMTEMFNMSKLSEIGAKLKELGFKHTSLDIAGYISK